MLWLESLHPKYDILWLFLYRLIGYIGQKRPRLFLKGNIFDKIDKKYVQMFDFMI